MWLDADGFHNDGSWKWVEAGTFNGPVYAEMAKDLLKQNEIPCLINKTFISSAYGLFSTNCPGMTVKILVPEILLEESREILAMLVDEWGDK